ncbi:MAG: 23S rRNA (adenine(2503)-C(2))-methyltransferase RlmN [Firmicutes bacterium]|nr:23S rRNA (adenine(2503)-C(2))-methyltransferase RlmN [Bacillota bacterium]
MINILDYTIKEFEEFIEKLGQPKFRARQVFDWIYKGVSSFDEMSNLPKDLRERLEKEAEIGLPEVVDMQVSKTDGTRKILFGLKDGNLIESVFMKYKYGNSICISSQAGCRMGCKFCASTLKGLNRNLTSGEMVGQILAAERTIRREALAEKESLPGLGQIDLKDDDYRVGHIVVMGTGEPFDNYDNLSKFLKSVHSQNGLNISNRNITVSTCGVVPMIERFGKEFPQVNLAISLHATTDSLRSSMMPINNKYPISKVIQAARNYMEETGRRITFEYTMVNGVNDRDEDADRLANLLRGLLCHVNIIPLNKVEGSGFDTVSRKRAMEFGNLLEKKRIPATVRRELGGDIDAACGQLRLKNRE